MTIVLRSTVTFIFIPVLLAMVKEAASTLRDGFEIRRAAAERRIPCYTSLDTARVAVESLLSGATAYSVERIDVYLKGSSRSSD